MKLPAGASACSELFKPQHVMVASVRNPHECAKPAETATKLSSSAGWSRADAAAIEMLELLSENGVATSVAGSAPAGSAAASTEASRAAIRASEIHAMAAIADRRCAPGCGNLCGETSIVAEASTQSERAGLVSGAVGSGDWAAGALVLLHEVLLSALEQQG